MQFSGITQKDDISLILFEMCTESYRSGKIFLNSFSSNFPFTIISGLHSFSGWMCTWFYSYLSSLYGGNHQVVGGHDGAGVGGDRCGGGLRLST